MSRVCLSRVTFLNVACEAYGWVMSRVCLSRVTHLNVACEAYGWDMSRVYSNRVTHWCGMWGIWMSHVTHMNGSCRANAVRCSVLQCVAVHHVTECITSLNEPRYRMSVMHRVDVAQINETPHMYKWVVSCHAIKGDVSQICHVYEFDMSHMCMSQVTHMKQTCHTHEWVMSHIWRKYVTHVSRDAYEWEISHIRFSHITHVTESRLTHMN